MTPVIQHTLAEAGSKGAIVPKESPNSKPQFSLHFTL
jgi:hypothetical protein